MRTPADYAAKLIDLKSRLEAIAQRKHPEGASYADYIEAADIQRDIDVTLEEFAALPASVH